MGGWGGRPHPRRCAAVENSVRKVLYLAIQRAAKKWTMPVQDWPAALNFYSIVFEGRVPAQIVGGSAYTERLTRPVRRNPVTILMRPAGDAARRGPQQSQSVAR